MTKHSKASLVLAIMTASLALASAVAWGQVGPAQVPSGIDAQALQSMATANQKTAKALEVSASISAIADTRDCKSSECVIATKAFAALAYMAGMKGGAEPAPTAAPQIINAAPPPTVGERVVGFLAGAASKLFDVGIALGPSYLNMRLGTEQSRNATALGIVQSNNALGATQSTNNTFAAFGANLQGLGTAGFAANQGIAVGGFNALAAQATALAQPGTVINVTGNCNGVNVGSGSAAPGCNTTTTTTTTTTDNSDRSNTNN